MNKGLVSAITALVKESPEDDDETPDDVEAVQEDVEVRPITEDEEGFDSSYELPLDIALVGCSNGDLKMFDEALCGPDAKHGQEALEYKINQLGKLGTWKVVDLPAGHTAILCSEVVKVKQVQMVTFKAIGSELWLEATNR